MVFHDANPAFIGKRTGNNDNKLATTTNGGREKQGCGCYIPMPILPTQPGHRTENCWITSNCSGPSTSLGNACCGCIATSTTTIAATSAPYSASCRAQPFDSCCCTAAKLPPPLCRRRAAAAVLPPPRCRCCCTVTKLPPPSRCAPPLPSRRHCRRHRAVALLPLLLPSPTRWYCAAAKLLPYQHLRRHCHILLHRLLASTCVSACPITSRCTPLLPLVQLVVAWYRRACYPA